LKPHQPREERIALALAAILKLEIMKQIVVLGRKKGNFCVKVSNNLCGWGVHLVYLHQSFKIFA
jgi:hypothetical protein